MKRFIAALLTVAMAVSFVPFSVFAEGSGTESLPETSAESTAAQQEEMARALQSTYNPFGRNYVSAQTEENQSQQAEVDTSDVSLTATNSFGQLLVNSMDEQNGTNGEYTSRVTGLKMNGHTATVEFVTDKAADLVVAVYTDSDAEEMVASGTVEVSGDGGNSSVAVAVQGDIPEYYTVKTFLLNKTTHEPLSQVYTDQSHTKNMVDLDEATIDDFPEDRSINFDDQINTNFAVVQENVKLIPKSETANQNVVTEDDNKNLTYQIENADEQFLSLKPEDIVVYPYAEEAVMIVKIKSINCSDNSVTLCGDDTLDLCEVFEVMKLSGSADNEDFVADEATGDVGISYEGLTAGLDETNDYGSTKEFSHTFKISSDDLKGDDGDEGDGDDSGWSTSGSLDGTVSINIKVSLAFNLKDGHEYFSFSMPSTEQIKISLTGAVKYKTLSLKELSVPISGVFSVGIAPKVVFSSTGKASIETTRSQTVGFKYSSLTGTQNLSTAPTTETDFKLDGTLYVGLDLCPKAKVALINKLELVSLELQAEAGLELNGSMKHGYLESGTEKVHACKTCFAGSLSAKITFGIGLKFLFFHPKVSIPVADWSLGKAYAAPDYHDFGWGTCPHVKYRVRVTLSGQNAVGTVIQIHRTDKEVEDLTPELNENNTMEIYLEAGEYKATATVENKSYSAQFTVKDQAINVTMETNEDEVASGTCGNKEDNVTWTLYKNGTLTIHGAGEMKNYNPASSDAGGIIAPWNKYRNDIRHVVVSSGISSLGTNVFDACENLETINLPTSMLVIGDGALNGCIALTSIDFPPNVTQIGDGAFSCAGLMTIKIPEGVTLIAKSAFSGCQNLTNVELSDNVETIGEYAFSGCKQLKEIRILANLKNIKKGAFYGCTSLKKVLFAGTKNQWNDIIIESYNDSIITATICCENTIVASGKCGESLDWKLSEGGTLTISGNGEMPAYETNSAVQPEEWKTAQKLVVEDGVTKIGKYAFDRCTALKDAEIAATVKTIDDSAFFSCANLENILLHDGIEAISASAFRACNSLQSAVLPKSITSIGSRAFQGDTSLTHADIMSLTTELPAGMFYNCINLERVRIPASVQVVASRAFGGCEKLTDAYFDGSKMQWQKISVSSGNEPLLSATIHCTDGDIIPASTSSENSVTTGSTTANNGTFCATFDNVSAGKDYAVIISRSANDPLNADNLIYINQVTADADGELSVPFRTGAGTDEMTYIVACARDDVIVDPDQPTEPDIPSDNDSGSSSGGGGAGAAVAGVVAVAAVVGVVLLMPVEVSGTVKLADQAALPGAAVQILKNDAVVAETATDAEGRFTMKVKRGNYTLRVRYVGADGYPVTKTMEIKAPSKNMDVAA